MGPLSLKKALLLLWLLLLPGEGTWYELNWWRIRFWGGRFFYFYLNGQGWEELTTNEVKSLQKARSHSKSSIPRQKILLQHSMDTRSSSGHNCTRPRFWWLTNQRKAH